MGGFKEKALGIPLLGAKEMKEEEQEAVRQTGNETRLWKVLPKLNRGHESPMPEGAPLLQRLQATAGAVGDRGQLR